MTDLTRLPTQTASFPPAGLASSLTLRRTLSQALLTHLVTYDAFLTSQPECSPAHCTCPLLPFLPRQLPSDTDLHPSQSILQHGRGGLPQQDRSLSWNSWL